MIDKLLGLLYNIYADKLLNLNFVPQNIYDMQSAFYPTIAQKYGVQLDTRNFYTKSKSPLPFPKAQLLMPI